MITKLALFMSSISGSSPTIEEATFQVLPRPRDLIAHAGKYYEVNYVIHPTDGSEPVLVCTITNDPIN